jgi:nucleoside 2-deoxyribosyltransferase
LSASTSYGVVSGESSIKPKVYCAGPLFNSAERQEMTVVAEVLTAAGYSVYLPHRDGMEFRLIHRELRARGYDEAVAGQFLHEAIFALDIYQLVVDCGAVVWNLNGRVPDEGAVSEAAIAWTLGKPMIGFADDARSLIAGRMNPLLAGLVEFEITADINQIGPLIEKQLAIQRVPVITPANLPERVRHAAEEGHALWLTLQSRAGEAISNEQIADCVCALFGKKAKKRRDAR